MNLFESIDALTKNCERKQAVLSRKGKEVAEEIGKLELVECLEREFQNISDAAQEQGITEKPTFASSDKARMDQLKEIIGRDEEICEALGASHAKSGQGISPRL